MPADPKRNEGQGPTTGQQALAPDPNRGTRPTPHTATSPPAQIPATGAAPLATAPAAPAPNFAGQQTEVVVQGRVAPMAPAAAPEPRPDRPNPLRSDETRPGGAYIQGDFVVDSEGRPIKGLTVQDGKIVEEEREAEE
jgi:hypothetical protein